MVWEQLCQRDTSAAMIKGKRDDSLALLRHAHWEKALVSANKDIDPATLLPIERATHLNSLHVYFELQRTIMLTIDTGLQPTEWGWKRVDELLVPTMTDSPVAPKELLEVIRCNWKMSSKNTYSTL